MKNILYTISIVILLIAGFLYVREGGSVADFMQENDPSLYKVVSFSDGDTIVVDMNGTREKVRFIGIDTPEINHPDKGVQCFAREAADFTKEIIGDNKVRLEADPNNSSRDRFDRLLRYVILPDGTNVNEQIVKEGYGFAYTAFNFTDINQFQVLEEEARVNERGLWSGCEIIQDDGYINTQPVTP